MSHTTFLLMYHGLELSFIGIPQGKGGWEMNDNVLSLKSGFWFIKGERKNGFWEAPFCLSKLMRSIHT